MLEAGRYRFGTFELELAERRLLKDGAAVALQPRARWRGPTSASHRPAFGLELERHAGLHVAPLAKERKHDSLVRFI